MEEEERRLVNDNKRQWLTDYVSNRDNLGIL